MKIIKKDIKIEYDENSLYKVLSENEIIKIVKKHLSMIFLLIAALIAATGKILHST